MPRQSGEKDKQKEKELARRTRSRPCVQVLNREARETPVTCARLLEPGKHAKITAISTDPSQTENISFWTEITYDSILKNPSLEVKETGIQDPYVDQGCQLELQDVKKT